MAIGSVDNSTVRGWVGRRKDFGLGDSSSGSYALRGVSNAINFGYPAFGASQPNVAAQWAGATWGLGATSNGGSIIDNVSSVTLAKSGSPTYGVAVTGIYSGISPGITMVNGNPPTGYFSKAGADANLNLGTSDFTIEIWFTNNQTFNGQTIIDTRDTVSGKGWRVGYNGGTDTVSMDLTATDGTGLTRAASSPSTLRDGNPHKLRIVGVRSGSIVFRLDGSVLTASGSSDISTLNGKSITAANIFVGVNGLLSAFSGWSGSIFEIRLSNNSSNNSGGLNGG